jgi:hypothetical protein
MKTKRISIYKCRANEYRNEMIQIASKIKGEFARKQVLEKIKDFSVKPQVISAHFLILVKSGVIIKMGKKHKYMYNAEFMNN